MARIHKQDEFIGIIATTPNKGERVISVTNPKNELAITQGSIGGWTAVSITNIFGAADGANSIVEVSGYTTSGVKRACGRLTETVDDLKKVFEEAGIALPVIKEATASRKTIEWVRHKLT